MLDTYLNDAGVECCDNCGAELGCNCSECGDHVTECACGEGPTYPAVALEDGADTGDDQNQEDTA